MNASRLAAALQARGIHYGWIVAATTFLTMLATAAAIRGACPAGGCCLALCCDRRAITAAKGSDKAALEGAALALPNVQRTLDGAAPKKIIVVPDRLVNIVV